VFDNLKPLASKATASPFDFCRVRVHKTFEMVVLFCVPAAQSKLQTLASAPRKFAQRAQRSSRKCIRITASHDGTSFGAAGAAAAAALVASAMLRIIRGLATFVLIVLRVNEQYHFIGVICLRHA